MKYLQSAWHMVVNRCRVRPMRNLVLGTLLALCVMGLYSLSVSAEGLQTVSLPEGGDITYGPLNGPTTQEDAMVFMLRQVHGHFGERPQVGGFFTAGDKDSIATFFTVHDTRHANRALAGMVIVVMPAGQSARAAVLTDDARHFNDSLHPMLVRLNSAMADEGASGRDRGVYDERVATSRAGANGSFAPSGASVATLHPTPFPDGSGSIGLPDGWKIARAYGGGVVANGPRGESVVLGRYISILDTSSPQAAQRVSMMTRGGRTPLPGSYVAYPSGGDPVAAFEGVANSFRRKAGQGPVTLSVKSRQPQGAGVVVRGIIHTASEEDKDSIISITATPPRRGMWGMMITQISAPVSLSAQEMPTLIAISRTYQANTQRIGQETQATIGRIHAIGAVATARANAAHAQEDAQSAAFQQHMDSIDRNSAGFANYLRDQTVVSTADNRYHGTFDNKTAQEIVESNPQQFQYVPTSGYIKGRDF